MAVLPSSKVATLASKFNALILEKECSPAQQKVAVRLHRTLPTQKAASAALRRRHAPCEGDGRRQCRKRVEESCCRKADADGPKRSPSTASTGSVAAKTARTAVTSVKDAIRIFEGNSRPGPPVPRKPKQTVEIESLPGREDDDRVASLGDAPPAESADDVAMPEDFRREERGATECGEDDAADVISTETRYENVRKVAAAEGGKEEEASVVAAPEEEENDGGYEPVQVPSPDKPAPLVRPNSSFLWGTLPQPCSSAAKKPTAPDTASSSVAHGYASFEDDCYDDVGPPSEGEDEEEEEEGGGYETFAAAGVEGPPREGDGAEGGEERRLSVDYGEEEEGVYDDVRSLEASAAKAETASVSNCYESIYCGDGREAGDAGAAGDGRSVSSEESGGGSGGGSDSLSGIEIKSNSLYGRCGSALSDGGANSEGDGPHEVLSYQLTSLGTTKGGESERRSDTSDDWVDVEETFGDDDDESEGAVVVFRERVSRGRRSPKWSKKVRREWSSRRRSQKNREGLDMESDQHHYETLYEMVGGMVHPEHQETCTVLVQEKLVPSNPPSQRQHALPYENLSDDDDFDSFDSDVTEEFEDQVPTKELPSIPNEMSKIPLSHGAPLSGANANGITKKMAEVAGKKMQEFRKNWSIRKHDISRSLKRIRKKSGSEVTVPGVLSHPQPPLPPTPDSAPPFPPPSRPPTAALPPPPRYPCMPAAPLPNHSAPLPPPPAPLNKSVSSGSLTGRKYWSFKSRFGRRESASTSSLQGQSSASPSTSPSSSTFYLTETVNVDTGLTETAGNAEKDRPIERRSSGNSLRWSVSGEDVIQRPKNVEEKRKSISSKPPVTRRLSIRPRGPPPPPPNCQNVIQNGDTRSCATSPFSSGASLTYAPPSSASSSSSSSSPYAFHCNRSSPTTSWYADMDVGLQRAGSLDESVTKKNRENKNSTVSWYADIGLWTAKHLQNIQDNGRNTDTSDSSSSTVASPEGSLVHGQFTDEPLYQFYTASVAEKVKRDISQDFDSDGYEEIGEFKSDKQPSPRPKAMDLVRHKEGCRTLWCQIPEVIASGLLDTFNSHQRKIQEAKFEVVTSEASYLKSLNILVSHFLESQSLNDETLLSKSDREVLFSNVLPVKQCSERFLADLERCWQEDILLLDICEIISRHAEKYFNVYVSYCSNQVHLDRALHRLKKSSQFLETIAAVESHPVCQSLSLHSFLMLPMQRVTRLPLLVDAILRRIPKDDSKYGACQVALATLNKVVQECNEGARHAERLEEMKVLSKQLDFREVGSSSLLNGGRWLVRKGELIHLHWRDDPSSLLGVTSAPAVSSVSSTATTPAVPPPSISTSKLTFGRKMMKQSLFLFLFTDLLVITKKKSEEHFLVLDFCPRNLVEIVAGLDGLGGPGSLQQLPQKYFSEGGKNIFLLSMLQNHENRTVEMVLSSSQESEKERWLEAFTPASSDNPDEQVYEEWDCPQVAAIHHYVAQQPDELSLEQSDVVNVLRKLPDGWYLGERIRDGEKGWFPANHCSEIASSHVRAKNLRQRYRLLALSGDYLEHQRRERALAKLAKKKKKLKKESKKE